MKKTGLILSALLALSVVGCSSSIREGHFKIEYFKDKHKHGTDLVFLTCDRQKQNYSYARTKQYPAGRHNILVTAYTEGASIIGYSYVQMMVNLEAGKRYQLARKVDGENISIWLEDANTKANVSGVVKAKVISRPEGMPVKTSRDISEMCSTSTL